jgi:carbamoyl-phosphate synthase small subunit
VLVLEDGRTFHGQAYGRVGQTVGEAVFSTGMTGYQETLTDPSYHRQVVVMTAPHVGNTGYNDEDQESGRIWVAGYVVRDPARRPSNWRSQRGLGEELDAQGVVGISGVDTRALTRHLRERGAMKVGVFSGDAAAKSPAELLQAVKDAPDMEGTDLASLVSTDVDYVVPAVGERKFSVTAVDLGIKSMTPHRLAEHGIEVTVVPSTVTLEQVLTSGPDGTAPDGVFFSNGPGDPAAATHEIEVLHELVAVDLGIKSMTPHRFAERGVQVHVVPADTGFEQIRALAPRGVFFSNGPGDPATAERQIETLREVLRAGIPFFGICFGNQLLGRALGFGTYKLVFGHRGINQPVLDRRTGRVEITAHNHGFAVDAPLDGPVEAPLGEFGRVEVSHVCLNDDVVEGLNCLDLPAFSVQYHPEAAAGPHDASYLFGRFIELMDSHRDGRADPTVDNAVPGGAQGAQSPEDTPNAQEEGQN